MSRVELISTPYAGRSIIASGMECVNLYAEINASLDPQAPAEVTYYPTPGTILFADPAFVATARGAYRTSLGTAYYVVGQNLYELTTVQTLVFIGAIANLPSQVYFTDNGLVLIIVDGENGFVVDLATNTLAQITDPNFFGANYVALLDTFIIFNLPGTNQFYITESNPDFGDLTNTSLGTGNITAPGSGGVLGLYQSVPLTGGSGTGATADIQVVSGIIGTFSITAGTGYVNGFYPAIPLTGGSGQGATADITVVGGGVTVVSFTGANDLFGSGYTATNVLTTANTNIGGTGINFEITINTVVNGVGGVTIDDPGINYLVGDVLSAASASIGNVAGFTYKNQIAGSAFNSLDIAAKSGFNDPIIGLLSVHRELWLVGALTTEVWIDTGAADFTFQEQQGAFINHGCAAQDSLATMDILLFFIMQDLQGNNIVVQGQSYSLTEISTPRIVAIFNSYATTSDAIGFCFQIEDHSFYCLIFPTANKAWLYDVVSKQWCEWNATDPNGNLIRPRANCYMFFNGLNLVGAFDNGQILQLSINAFQDTENPIIRIRTFPHSVDSNEKVSYLAFTADIEPGTIADNTDPQISLSWSDDKGKTYGNPVMQSMGEIGNYLTVPTWNRLGEARDRVFKLSWSTNNSTALNGGFVDLKPARK